MGSIAEQKIRKIKQILKIEDDLADVVITPDMARELLRFNTNNRKISDVTVSNYSRYMKNDQWKIDSSMITFSNTGEISNGQHRLNALIKSNKSIKFTVKFGVDNYAEMDRGKGRTITDNISTSDEFRGTIIAESKDIQQIATLLIRVHKGGKVETSDVIKVLEKYGNDLLYLKDNGIFKGVRGLENKAISAGLFTAYKNGIDLNILRNIRDVLSSGVSQGEKDAPIIGLRDRLLNIKGGGIAVEKDRYRSTLYCVNAVAKGFKRKTCKPVEPKYKIDLT